MGSSNNTIKRNRKILASLKEQKDRLKIDASLKEFLKEYLFPRLLSADIISAINIEDNEEMIKDILDKENILLEMLKVIGVMEVSKDKDIFQNLTNVRDEIKNKNLDLTDFDKILKSMMKVPKPKE